MWVFPLLKKRARIAEITNKINPIIAAAIKMYEKINRPIIKITIISPIVRKGTNRAMIRFVLFGFMVSALFDQVAVIVTYWFELKS